MLPLRSVRALLAVAVPTVLGALAVPGTGSIPATPTATPPPAVGGESPGAGPPNVVLITTDDQTLRDMQHMPKTRRLLGDSGVTFRNALSPHPLCCPARAEILTGQFAQNNGVRTNIPPYGGVDALISPDNVLPVWLQAAGYTTVFMGKYLNGYGSHAPADIPAGWDDWNGSYRGVYDYDGVSLNHNGTVVPYVGRIQADVYADLTADLVGDLAGDRPFFLWQSQLAPHSQRERNGGWVAPTASKRNAGTFVDEPLDSRSFPSYNEADVSDKPTAVSELPRLGARAASRLTVLNRGRLESLQDVDDAVASMVRRLKEVGEYDDTLILFTSDNGFLMGEHRYIGKALPYEASVRVPLLMTGPSLPAGELRRQPVTLVDLAPTILDAAGATAGRVQDGRSLLPAARSRDAAGWDTVLVQAGPPGGDGDNPLPQATLQATEDSAWLYRGVRTARYTYARYLATGEEELYDRRLDPFQLDSLAGNPRYAAVQEELSRRTDALKGCAGDCWRAWSPVPQPGA